MDLRGTIDLIVSVYHNIKFGNISVMMILGGLFLFWFAVGLYHYFSDRLGY